MTTQNDLGSVTVILLILLVMAAAAVVEAAIPLFAAERPATGRRPANLGMTAQTLTFNFLLAWAVGMTTLVKADSAGPMERAGLPFALQVAIGFVALDFAFGYVAHRAMHAFPLLWRFHRVHHSDAFVDVTTTYRTHPVESAWRYLCLLVPIWLLGLSPAVVAAYRVLSAVNGILEHANIRVKPEVDSAISQVWVTPNLHKVHHSRDQAETDTNYGNLLSLYDRALGTFTPGDRASSVTYGLDDVDPATTASMTALLAMPFVAAPRSGPVFDGLMATRGRR